MDNLYGADSSLLAGKRERGKSNSYYLGGVTPANNLNSQLLLSQAGIAGVGNIKDSRTPFPLNLRAYKIAMWVYSASVSTQLELDTFYALVQSARIRVIRQETVETLSFSVNECLDVSAVNGVGAVQIQNLSKFQPISGDIQNFAMAEDIKIFLDNFASVGLPQVGFNIVLKGVTK